MANLLDWIKQALSRDETEEKEQSIVETRKGWVISVTGVVKRVSKTDVDKSGRNPKYTYSFTVEKETASCENCEFKLEEKIRFSVKEKQMIQALGREIKQGDRIEVTSTGLERRPRIFFVSMISLHES